MDVKHVGIVEAYREHLQLRTNRNIKKEVLQTYLSITMYHGNIDVLKDM